MKDGPHFCQLSNVDGLIFENMAAQRNQIFPNYIAAILQVSCMLFIYFCLRRVWYMAVVQGELLLVSVWSLNVV